MRKLVPVAIAAIILTAACQGRNKETSADTAVAQAEPAMEEVRFPMPKVPDFITGQEERMAYALEHYWQAYEFNDTTKANRDMGEQGFSTFLVLLQHADSAITAKAIERYLEKGFALPSLRALHNGMIRHYLDNPNSPMRNDALYTHFLRAQLKFYNQDESAERERCAFLLDMVSRNLPGTIAQDFRYIDRNGKPGSLHAIESPLTLVIFNDPDCETCQQEMPVLMADPLLQSTGLAVLAVYPDANTELWEAAESSMPSSWTDAYSPNGEIMLRALYYLPAMPSLYLLDKDKRVLLKDATPQHVRQFLTGQLSEQTQTNAPR